MVLYKSLCKHFEEVEKNSDTGMCMIATREDAQRGLEAARSKKGGKFVKPGKHSWKETLAPGQLTRLQAYHKLWQQRFGRSSAGDKRAFFHLNDDPAVRCVWSGKQGCIPTMRKSMGPIWSDYHSRPVLVSEMLTSMGWFVDEKLAAAAGVSTFPIDDSINYRKLIGNSMHLANVTAVLLTALASVKRASSRDAAELVHDFVTWTAQ